MGNLIQTATPRSQMTQNANGHPDFGHSSQDYSTSMWPDFLVGQPGTPVRVLLIDDDANMRSVVSRELFADLRTDLALSHNASNGAPKEIAVPYA